MRFYDNHKILHDCQHGFRTKRPCETLLIAILQSIASELKGRNQANLISQKRLTKCHTSGWYIKYNTSELEVTKPNWSSCSSVTGLLKEEMSSEKDVVREKCFIRCPQRHWIGTTTLPGIHQWPPWLCSLIRYQATGLPHYNAIFGVHRTRPCYKWNRVIMR